MNLKSQRQLEGDADNTARRQVSDHQRVAEAKPLAHSSRSLRHRIPTIVNQQRTFQGSECSSACFAVFHSAI